MNLSFKTCSRSLSFIIRSQANELQFYVLLPAGNPQANAVFTWPRLFRHLLPLFLLTLPFYFHFSLFLLSLSMSLLSSTAAHFLPLSPSLLMSPLTLSPFPPSSSVPLSFLSLSPLFHSFPSPPLSLFPFPFLSLSFFAFVTSNSPSLASLLSRPQSLPPSFARTPVTRANRCVSARGAAR